MSTLSTDVGTVDDVAAVAYCLSCPHPEDVHDATARRYCAATLHGSMARGCICRGDLVDVVQRPNSVRRFP